MSIELKKSHVPKDAKNLLKMYTVSITPNENKILGVMGRYMYVEVTGHVYVPGTDIYPVNPVVREGEMVIKTMVVKVTIKEFQKLFGIWIQGKKRICESYGHWCGAFGNIHAEEFKVVGSCQLTKFNQELDCDDPDFVYYEECPIIQVSKWSNYADFEHG